jgi:hypothetical protein
VDGATGGVSYDDLTVELTGLSGLSGATDADKLSELISNGNITFDLPYAILGTGTNEGSNSLGQGLVGEAGRDDDIYSGGLDTGKENVQGTAGTGARTAFAGSGNDRLIFDKDDVFLPTDSGNTGAGSNGQIRVRGFTMDAHPSVNSDSDTIVLGDLLMHEQFVDGAATSADGLTTVNTLGVNTNFDDWDGTVADAVRFLHFVEGGVQNDYIYIDLTGTLGDENSADRALIGNSESGLVGGSNLSLRFYTFDSNNGNADKIDFNAGGDALNTVAQLQSLVDLGFIDLT